MSVALGPTIPDVIGLTLSEALSTLAALSITVTEIYDGDDQPISHTGSPYDTMEVRSTDPAAGIESPVVEVYLQG